MSKRHLHASILILAANLAGCGGFSPGKPGPPTPHGGALVPLPDEKGFAEVLKQPAPGKAGRSTIVVYFLDRDRNAISPTPSAATFTGQATGNKVVTLKPLDGADASKAGGLASEPINDRGEIEGQLTATVGGAPVTVPLLLR